MKNKSLNGKIMATLKLMVVFGLLQLAAGTAQAGESYAHYQWRMNAERAGVATQPEPAFAAANQKADKEAWSSLNTLAASQHESYAHYQWRMNVEHDGVATQPEPAFAAADQRADKEAWNSLNALAASQRESDEAYQQRMSDQR